MPSNNKIFHKINKDKVMKVFVECHLINTHRTKSKNNQITCYINFRINNN